MPYRFFHDPSHGWLEVPTAELRELGIAGRTRTARASCVVCPTTPASAVSTW